MNIALSPKNMKSANWAAAGGFPATWNEMAFRYALRAFERQHF
jgi:hypothetical protein